jgi:hypothetical protein
MKKMTALILAFVMLLGLSYTSVFAKTNNHEAMITFGGDVSEDNIPGLSVRNGSSGRMLTRVGTTTVNLSGVIIGWMETQAFWEIDTGRNIIGHGPMLMRTSTVSPRYFHGIELGANHIPHPTVAWVSFNGYILTEFGYSGINHNYHMYNNGTYAYSVNH